MISEVTARHYGFVILPSDIRIKSANNAVTAVVGTTDLVTVDIQGHSCQLTLVVLDHDDHEVLLGLDWFMATGASFASQNPYVTISRYCRTLALTSTVR